MRTLILISFILVKVTSCFSQSKQNYEWVTGFINSNVATFQNNEFKFNRYIDTGTANKKYYFVEGASNICASNGRILLMSNGYNVLDSNKSFVDGLDSIGGRVFMKYMDGFARYTQYSIFLPVENGIYYFVNGSVSDSFMNYYYNTPNAEALFDELLYTKIDINGNGGMGKVLQREIKLLKNETLSKVQMMACKHGNGKDWWLFKQGRVSNRVYKFLFSKDSVISYGTQQFPEPLFSKWDNLGQSMFNQQGNKYATTCGPTGKVFIAEFDRCNGILSNPSTLNIDSIVIHNPFDTTLKDNTVLGLAFSPNGQFLYLSMGFNIIQFDLDAANIQASRVIVAELDTTWQAFQPYSSMYLGPDSRLYIGNNGSVNCKQMSYFEFPNEKGLASGFCKRCFRFPKVGVTAPPNMPNYDLGAANCWPLSNYELGIKNDELEVYPNPAYNKLYIQTSIKGKRELYNSLGQLVISTNENEIDVSGLSSGVYFMKCGFFTKKIIVE
jgi:hypothetical protein